VWAVTVHLIKSQGLTIPKMHLALGRREVSSGLTFVAVDIMNKFCICKTPSQLEISD
jgi:hypothetical protein